MQTITSQSELKAEISRLEQKQQDEKEILKAQFRLTYDSLRPANIMLNAIKELGASNDLKDNIINSSVGLGVGYFSKILFQSLVKSPVKKLLGSALMFGVTNLISKNPDIIKLMGQRFFKLLRGKSETKSEASKNS